MNRVRGACLAAPVVGAAQLEGYNIMKRTLTLAAALAATALTGLSAHASCADPRASASGSARQIPQIVLKGLSGARAPQGENAADNIVGTWLVTYTVEGSPFGQAYIQWHSDGTEWENINLPLSGGNICMGSWQAVGSKHVARNHWGWLYTDGDLSGYFNETETNKVARNGTYAGTNEQKGYDLNGNLLFDVTGTSSAVQIAP
jgi:hypothetical protein